MSINYLAKNLKICTDFVIKSSFSMKLCLNKVVLKISSAWPSSPLWFSLSALIAHSNVVKTIFSGSAFKDLKIDRNLSTSLQYTMSDMAISFAYNFVCVFWYSSNSCDTNTGSLLFTFITTTLMTSFNTLLYSVRWYSLYYFYCLMFSSAVRSGRNL